MNDRIKALYQSEIMRHAKNPSHEGELAGASHVLSAYNPLCGDQYRLYLRIAGGIIEDASFTGYGCAISKASTSILTDRCRGESLTGIKPLIALFRQVLDPDSPDNPEALTSDDELLAFSATRIFPERAQCASLAWDELDAWLMKNT